MPQFNSIGAQQYDIQMPFLLSDKNAFVLLKTISWTWVYAICIARSNHGAIETTRTRSDAPSESDLKYIIDIKEKSACILYIPICKCDSMEIHMCMYVHITVDEYSDSQTLRVIARVSFI